MISGRFEVMLRKRSRGVTSKKTVMAENGSLSSSSTTNNQIRPISSFFSCSPKFFTGFSVKGVVVTETESLMMSPTSILDSLGNPFWSDRNTNTTRLSSVETTCLENKHSYPWEKKLDSKGLVDALLNEGNDDDDDDDQKSSKTDSRMVVFGSQLKIQIPSIIPPPSVLSPSESSPKSPPADFGIKTRNSQLGSLSFSPGSIKKSPFGFENANSGPETPQSPPVFTGCLSAKEMELSEDYTCVIAHGPNPKTIHIFGDCIVENCCGVVGFSGSKKENCYSVDPPSYPSEKFLSFCYNCKKNLGHGKDIFMYRGEKAFCSHECRCQEMLFDEGLEK